MYTCQLIAHLSSLKRYGSQTFHNALFIYLRIKNHHTKIFLYMPASHYFFCVTGARTVNSHFCMTQHHMNSCTYSTVCIVYHKEVSFHHRAALHLLFLFGSKKKKGHCQTNRYVILKAHAWQQTVEITSRTIIEISMKQNKTRKDSLHSSIILSPRCC